MIERESPSLTLVYLPHLDYNLQRLGPSDPRCRQDIREIDAEAGKVIAAARNQGAEIVILSEYAITDCDQPDSTSTGFSARARLPDRPRREMTGWETLDFGRRGRFAALPNTRSLMFMCGVPKTCSRSPLLRVEGVERVLDREAQAGLVSITNARASWSSSAAGGPGSYYFWLDDALAPDYARTVDIHRKPGYDPVELLVDPQFAEVSKAEVREPSRPQAAGLPLLHGRHRSRCQHRQGSHGRLPDPGREESDAPVFVCSSKAIETDDWPLTAVRDRLLKLQF